MMPKSKEFVSSDSESDGEPRAKKRKSPKKEEKKEEKKEKSSAASSKTKEGESMFQLAKMKYAVVSEFKGRKMVNIREFYNDANGDLKPGKKGIALMEDQWRALKNQMDEIDEALEDL